MKKRLLALLFAFATVCGFAQESTLDKDSVTISFQLASKAAGEKATLIFSDYTACDVVDLNPVTDKEGKWSVKLPSSFFAEIRRIISSLRPLGMNSCSTLVTKPCSYSLSAMPSNISLSLLI